MTIEYLPLTNPAQYLDSKEEYGPEPDLQKILDDFGEDTIEEEQMPNNAPQDLVKNQQNEQKAGNVKQEKE